jgi:hypothetical protein
MTKEKKKVEEVLIEKTTTVTWLSIKGCHCTPLRQPTGRIAFRVKGPISELLGELSQNPRVNILDFLNRYEMIRSIIFSLKDQKQMNIPALSISGKGE